MSRIRSVHPGLFTDEAFVCLSDAAQIFFIGLWTECDDQGAFEWKPVQLRLKIRGNRDGSVDPLLEELEASNCIKSYEHNGRKYGVVRNFTRFQRPKKPNSVHFIPPELRTFAGSSAVSSEPVPHQSPTSGGKSPQMEDGGGRMEEEEEGEREQVARTPEPKHWREVTGYLASKISQLTDWEIGFLQSVRQAEVLTRPQSDSLRVIREKLQLADSVAVGAALPSVRRGTKAYDAWINHFRKRGRAAFYERQESFTVPSEFPPPEAVEAA